MEHKISDEKLALMVNRLKSLKGPGDQKGAFLGNGMPDMIGCELRSLELADLLEELQQLRALKIPSDYHLA